MSLQLLQEDLELEQVRVNSLTHMVVVVDENSGDGATAALEEKLQVNVVLFIYTTWFDQYSIKLSKTKHFL